MPIRIGAEFDYYVAQTDNYGLRFMVKHGDDWNFTARLNGLPR